MAILDVRAEARTYLKGKDKRRRCFTPKVADKARTYLKGKDDGVSEGQQIPFGDDNQRGESKDEIRGFLRYAAR